MKIIKKKVLKKTTKKALVAVKKTNHTPAYYHCLAAKASQGCLKSGKIANCCQECKKQSASLAAVRQQEIKKLTEAYKQIGTSLTKLLAHG